MNDSKRLTEEAGIVYVLKPADHQAGAAGDSIKASLYRHITFLIQFAGLTGDAVLTVKSGATDGTETTAETFRYRLAGAVQAGASADQYGAEASSSSLTLTAATYQNKTLVVEIDADQLTADQPFVTIAFSSAADALTASIIAILRGPRFQANNMPGAIPA